MLAFYFSVFGGFLCLIPLALYCLTVAGIYRRPTPTLISGPAEFAGGLLALSGFLIIGGPAVLAGWHESWRRLLARGSFADVAALLSSPRSPWIALWIAYFALVVVGAIVLFRRRRRWLTICNVEPDDAVAALLTAAEQLRAPATRAGSRVTLGGAARSAVLIVRPAPLLRSVTLAWQRDPADFQPMFEDELRRVLRGVRAPASPIAGWLLTIAGVLFVVQFVALIMLALMLHYSRP